MKLKAILEEVMAERQRQDEKWGEQNHPLLAGKASDWPFVRNTLAGIAEITRETNDTHVQEGTLGWRTILQEEVLEAFAEEDIMNARAELVQVAAVAVAIIECIDRNAGNPEWNK